MQYLRYPPPSLLNESITLPYFPTMVNHAASARWLAASPLPHPLPVSTTGTVGRGRVLGRGMPIALRQGLMEKMRRPQLELAGANSKSPLTWSVSSSHPCHIGRRSFRSQSKQRPFVLVGILTKDRRRTLSS